MSSLGDYLGSVVALGIFGAAICFAAFRTRRHLLPHWTGAPARLVEVIFGIALAIWLSQLLALVGVLYTWTLIIEALLLAAAVALWPVRSRDELLTSDENAPKSVTVSSGMTAIAIAVVALVFADWGVSTKTALDQGISNFDSLWYHMPFAAEIAQGHPISELYQTNTVYTNWFYPQNSELLHGIGIMLVGHDTLSLFLNIGWLGLSFLAAWCVGRPFGRGQLCVVAVAVVLGSMTLIEREPGQAKNDVMAAALVLAALAIMLNAWSTSRRILPIGWPLAAAGLAAGLAAGTRVTVLPLVALLSVVAVVLVPPESRGRTARWWFLPLLAGGALWYVRNLAAAGNPLPQIGHLGPIALSHPDQVQSGRPNFTVAHYFLDGAVWRDYFVPGLEHAFGILWPVVLGGAILGGSLAAIQTRQKAVRWFGLVALGGLLGYLLTPLSAAGEEGAPVAFVFNLRFVVPSLLIGVVLLPLTPMFKHRSRQWALLGGLLLVILMTDQHEFFLNDHARLFGLALAGLVVVAPTSLLATRRPGESAWSIAGPLCALALVVVVIGFGVQRDYLHNRYRANSGLPGYGLEHAYTWAKDVRGARIGIVGSAAGFASYGFYGADLSNQVRYLGEAGTHGAFNPIPDCRAFRSAVNRSDLDYVVTTPFLVRGRLQSSPEGRWLVGESAVEPIVTGNSVTVWRVKGRLDPGSCGSENAPLYEVPRQSQL